MRFWSRTCRRCSVLGCPSRMDFSRADAALIASKGRATSMNFFVTCPSATRLPAPPSREPGFHSFERIARLVAP